ncbi:hypothetical protein BBG13_12770 [Actinomyces oris]|nr:hypothetical protein BBG13_12770 [Actinomyces oris]
MVMVTSWETQLLALSATFWASESETFGAASVIFREIDAESRDVAAFCAAWARALASREEPLAELVVVKVVPSSLRITVALRALARSSGIREVA